MGQTVGRIKKNYAQLRASERKVADWVLRDPAKVPEMTMAQLAAAAGVKVYGLSSYFIGEPEKGEGSRTVILGYASLTEEEIREGAERLTRAWTAVSV